MIITLGRQLPDASSDLPGSSGGPPSSAPLCGLAPDGVCLASPVTRGTGELLPRRFTLTLLERRAVCFLWHFPWGHPRSPLATILALWSPDFPLAAGINRTPAITCPASTLDNPYKMEMPNSSMKWEKPKNPAMMISLKMHRRTDRFMIRALRPASGGGMTAPAGKARPCGETKQEDHTREERTGIL